MLPVLWLTREVALARRIAVEPAEASTRFWVAICCRVCRISLRSRSAKDATLAASGDMNSRPSVATYTREGVAGAWALAGTKAVAEVAKDLGCAARPLLRGAGAPAAASSRRTEPAGAAEVGPIAVLVARLCVDTTWCVLVGELRAGGTRLGGGELGRPAASIRTVRVSLLALAGARASWISLADQLGGEAGAWYHGADGGTGAGGASLSEGCCTSITASGAEEARVGDEARVCKLSKSKLILEGRLGACSVITALGGAPRAAIAGWPARSC